MKEIEDKANYCLNCKVKPCSAKGCPLNNNIPDFIEKIKEGNYKEAYKILSETTVLPGVCGIICPHTKQCQGACIRGIKGESVSIGELESFIFEKAMEESYRLKDCWKDAILNNSLKVINKKVAIIGGGPAGLTAAAFLVREGIKVTIYEKYNYLGGLLMHGIPEFRLNKEILKETIKNILELGIEVKYNHELEKNIKLEELEKEYDAIFLSIGANVSNKMNVEGENLKGVYGGNELLEHKLHPGYNGKTVSIIGGGNVAIDCARTVKKLGAKEVKIIYRRSREEMPAEEKEILEALKEGIEILFQNNVIKIIGNEKVEKIELIKTKLIQKEGEKRLSPINIDNSNYIIDTDYIVMALGARTDKIVNNLGLEINKWGNIIINEKYQTSKSNIYAGGDLAGIKGTVAWASYSGREAARNIIEEIIKGH